MCPPPYALPPPLVSPCSAPHQRPAMLRGPDISVLQLMAMRLELLLTEVIINWTQLCVRPYCPHCSSPLLETPSKRDSVQHVCAMAQALSYSDEGRTGGRGLYQNSWVQPWPMATPHSQPVTRHPRQCRLSQPLPTVTPPQQWPPLRMPFFLFTFKRWLRKTHNFR